MKRLGTVLVAVTWLVGCASEVLPAEPREVDVAEEALAVCNIPKGTFTNPWTSRVTFSQASADIGPSLTSARNWLTSHLVTIDLSTGAGGKLLSWSDSSFNPAQNVSYFATDALWTAYAIQPWDFSNFTAITGTLINAGRYGNQIYDSLFHDVGSVLYRKTDGDKVHGQLLNTCTATNGRSTQVRVFNYGSPVPAPDPRDSYVDTMVYAALDEFWTPATRQNGINRLLGIIARSNQFDSVFWDQNMRVFVDVASKADFDNGGDYWNATFKVGLVLYAIRVMGITGISSRTIDGMKARLREAQHTNAGDFLGGLAHEVRYDSSGNFRERRPPTGEATAIGIMAYTANQAQ